MALVKTRRIQSGRAWGYPAAAVVPDVASLLEYINTVCGTCGGTIDVVNVIFLIAISEGNKKPVCFYKAAGCTHRLATGLCSCLSVTTEPTEISTISIICGSRISRRSIDLMTSCSFWFGEQEWIHILDALVKHVCQGLGDKPTGFMGGSRHSCRQALTICSHFPQMLGPDIIVIPS